MLGENSNSPEFIKQDKLDAKLIREKYPVAFKKPTNEEIARMGKKMKLK